MIRVMFFIKKADHLSLNEFQEWWFNTHVPHVCTDQSPYLAEYQVCTKTVDLADLPGGIAQGDLDWDGVAIQSFRTMDDYLAVYGKKERGTTKDTLKHIKEIKRMIVRALDVDLNTGASSVARLKGD